MNIKNNAHLKYQNGAATLFTAVMLLVATTLVTFLTAKTVLQETKMGAIVSKTHIEKIKHYIALAQDEGEP